MDIKRLIPTGVEIPIVAVAVTRSSPVQTHAGIVHRIANGPMQLLHLRWNKIISNQTFSPPTSDQYICAIPGVDEERLKQITALCRLVARVSPAIPYALRYSQDTEFDIAVGNVIPSVGYTGMNCSTFALTLLHRSMIRLVDYKTWPENRPGDIETQKRLVSALKDSPREEDNKQAEIIEADIGCPRVRAEESGGACLIDNPPVVYCDAVIGSAEILKALNALFPTYPPLAVEQWPKDA